MRVRYDPIAQALYIKILEGNYKRKPGVEELVEDTVFIDKTTLGQIIGIEVLGVESIEDITNRGVKE